MILSLLMYLLCTLFQTLNPCDKQECPEHKGTDSVVFYVLVLCV